MAVELSPQSGDQEGRQAGDRRGLKRILEDLADAASGVRQALARGDYERAIVLASEAGALVSCIAAVRSVRPTSSSLHSRSAPSASARAGAEMEDLAGEVGDLACIEPAAQRLRLEASRLRAVARDGQDFCGWLARAAFGPSRRCGGMGVAGGFGVQRASR